MPIISISITMLIPATSVLGAVATNKQQLHTTARVLPAQHIVVNEQGAIVEILSNTTEDVLPKVYLNRISKNTEQPLTPAIHEQYRLLVPKGASRVGVLYRKSILTPSLRIGNEITTILNQSKMGKNILASSSEL